MGEKVCANDHWYVCPCVQCSLLNHYLELMKQALNIPSIMVKLIYYTVFLNLPFLCHHCHAVCSLHAFTNSMFSFNSTIVLWIKWHIFIYLMTSCMNNDPSDTVGVVLCYMFYLFVCETVQTLGITSYMPVFLAQFLKCNTNCTSIHLG